jgi:hypothetical protein
MCCGQQRSVLKAVGQTQEADLNLLYYGVSPAAVRGPVTGRLYQFTKLQPVQAVDARDAAAILRTRLFRQVK